MPFQRRLALTLLTLCACVCATASRAHAIDRVNTEDWTLTLVINRGGNLEEKLSQFPTRRACYDAMHARIQETQRTRGHSAAGICLKMFVGTRAVVSEADDLFSPATTAGQPAGPRPSTSSVISQANDEHSAVQ